MKYVFGKYELFEIETDEKTILSQITSCNQDSLLMTNDATIWIICFAHFSTPNK